MSYHPSIQSREPLPLYYEAFQDALSKYDVGRYEAEVKNKVLKGISKLPFPKLPVSRSDPLQNRDFSYRTVNPNVNWPCKDKSIVLGSHYAITEKLVVSPFQISAKAWKQVEGGASNYVNHGMGQFRPVGYAREEEQLYADYFLTQAQWSEILRRVMVDTTPSQDAALAAALSDANSATYDIFTDLAEAPETIAMIVGLFTSVKSKLTMLQRLSRKTTPKQLQALRKILKKHGTPKAVPRHLSGALGYWLYYRYGVMPLYLSIKDAMEAGSRDHIEYETSRGNDTVNKKDSFQYGPFDVDCKVVARARGYVKTGFGELGKQRVGGHLPTTLWEVVPFSFVVDWFVGVGDFITSYKSVNFKQRRGTVSLSVEVDVSVSLNAERLINAKEPPEPFTRSSWTPVTGLRNPRSSGKTTYTLKKYSRSLSDLKPKLTTKAQALSWMRQLDALALSWKLLESLKRK